MQKPFITFVLVTISLSLAIDQQCSIADEKVLRRRRIQGLRASILAQLGFKELPNVNTSIPIPADIAETFRVITAASGSLGQERSRTCESQETYAQPISAFVGSIEGGVISTNKRSTTENIHHLPANVLAEYAIHFEFDLPENLTDVIKGDLLLYKIPPYHITDTMQYVEIKAVIEKIGLKTTITTKYVDPRTEGFEVFNILPAVRTWLTQDVTNVTLLVTIKCLSSSDCGLLYKTEQQVMKFKDYDAHEQAPRILVSSRNPLEAETRTKRQSSIPGVSFCSESQSTCCLKKLTIDFHNDLGFTFIKQPRFIQANYCEGVCPTYQSGDLMTPSVYKFLSKLQGSPASSIEPCCAGNTFNDVSIVLQVTNTSYVIESLKQVEVTSCRCA